MTFISKFKLSVLFKLNILH